MTKKGNNLLILNTRPPDPYMKMLSPNVKKKTGLLLVNFGGPRDAAEIPSFIQALLCDQEVVRTPLPGPIHRLLFSYIAKKRAKKVTAEYESIGGQSPIYYDTENVAAELRLVLPDPVLVFHRYLPATHPDFIRKTILSDVDEWIVFPMFPQFSYATTGSIAKWFAEKLPKHIQNQIFWLKSYPNESPYVELFEKRIRSFMEEKQLDEKDCFLFFSAHGIPKKFVIEGDPYKRECELSYEAITSKFTESTSLLAYQSKFGRGEWLRPYTIDRCSEIKEYAKDKKHIIFIPLAFTSDHLETLYEIESEYMPVVEESGYRAHRLPAFNDKTDWITTITKLIKNTRQSLPNQMLLRRK